MRSRPPYVISPEAGCPSVPEMDHPRRARLLLHFHESGQVQESAEHGWAVIQGPWVLWLSDEDTRWQSWPMHNVLCIDWVSPQVIDRDDSLLETRGEI